MKCNDCIHKEACKSWIIHGETLYTDFDYSVEDCPFFQDKKRFAEVVRCSECVHRQTLEDGIEFRGIKPRYCFWHNAIVPDNGYCDCGIRKNE